MTNRPLLAAAITLTALAATPITSGTAEAGNHYKSYGWKHYAYSYNYKPVAPQYYVVQPVKRHVCAIWSHKTGHCLRWY